MLTFFSAFTLLKKKKVIQLPECYLIPFNMNLKKKVIQLPASLRFAIQLNKNFLDIHFDFNTKLKNYFMQLPAGSQVHILEPNKKNF